MKGKKISGLGIEVHDMKTWLVGLQSTVKVDVTPAPRPDALALISYLASFEKVFQLTCKSYLQFEDLP